MTRWEIPWWRVYQWVDQDEDTIVGRAVYFGRDLETHRTRIENMGMEGWCDFGDLLLNRLENRISSFVENTLLQPLSWASMKLGDLAGWFHVRKTKP
jgi:hypothetical protein